MMTMILRGIRVCDIVLFYCMP